MSFDYTPYWEAARLAAGDDPAHDFLHVKRVHDNAVQLLEGMKGKVDEQVVLTAVILHELFNYPKGHPESHLSGDVCAERAEVVLCENGFPADQREAVLTCIREHSFSKGIVPIKLEGRIVQDADRLDAIGAIGIARCFATSQEMKRPFYEANDPLARNRTPNDKEYGIDHFFIKLLHIESRLHTEKAKRMAWERTEFMKAFLNQLEKEVLAH